MITQINTGETETNSDIVQPSSTTTRKSTLFLFTLPSATAFLTTLISFLYTQVIFSTDNCGRCIQESAYTPNAHLTCTPEQAACAIVLWFDNPMNFLFEDTACGPARNERHLVIALFAAASVLFAITMVKYVTVGPRAYDSVESAEN